MFDITTLYGFQSVSVTVVAFLKASDEDLTIEEFDVDMQWKSMAFKFEKIAGRFSTLADFSMNQVSTRLSFFLIQKAKI